MRKYQEFPDGFVERMTSREMSIIYKVLDQQVHSLVDSLLEYEGDKLVGRVSELADTSALAVRALKLNIGRTLPRYDYAGGSGRPEQVGETRIIEEGDQFEVVGGPFTVHPHRGFYTVLHRVATLDEIDAHTRTRLSCNDFDGIPIGRI